MRALVRGLSAEPAQLIEDAFRWVVLLCRSSESVQAENLFLRRQLALYLERGVQPRRIDAATRVSLAVLARLFDWRSALVVVQPATMIRWHRAGWRLFCRLKSRRGRPPIPEELPELIRRMGNENRLWGEERIANELLLKLGIRVSPRTVRKYLPKRPPGQQRGGQRWSTFLKNQTDCDSCEGDHLAMVPQRSVLSLQRTTAPRWTAFLRTTGVPGLAGCRLPGRPPSARR